MSSDQMTLKAIRSARLFLSSGAGLETVVFRLSKESLGSLSDRFSVVVSGAQQGGVLRDILLAEQRSAEKKRELPTMLLMGALASESHELDTRLKQVADEIADIARDQARTRARRIASALRIALILLALGALPPVAEFIISQISHSKIPWGAFYLVDCVALTILLILAGRKE